MQSAADKMLCVAKYSCHILQNDVFNTVSNYPSEGQQSREDTSTTVGLLLASSPGAIFRYTYWELWQEQWPTATWWNSWKKIHLSNLRQRSPQIQARCIWHSCSSIAGFYRTEWLPTCWRKWHNICEPIFPNTFYISRVDSPSNNPYHSKMNK